MIVKQVAMRSIAKSNFAELVRYLEDDQAKNQRVGETRISNCISENVPDAIVEILNDQATNVRARSDKTYHLIASFRPGEHVPDESLRAIEDRICSALGFADHKRISVVHHDTDNLHMHIAINKIHPLSRTIHEPYFPYRNLATLCVALEREFGLQVDNHAAQRTTGQGRADDMEHHAGVQSLAGWIKRSCADALSEAAKESWAKLHAVAAANGLKLRPRGNGLVFVADETAVKASTIGRHLSRDALERALGPFEPDAREVGTATVGRYRPEPVAHRIDTSALYQQYRAEQADMQRTRTAEVRAGQQERASRFDQAKRANQLRRSVIRVAGGGRLMKRLLYAQASSALRAQIRAARVDHANRRTQIAVAHRRLTWADWLKREAQQGNADALAALRARVSAGGAAGDSLQAARFVAASAGLGDSARIDSITKAGTVIVRPPRGATGSVRDDGVRLVVTADASRETVDQALRLAVQRYGTTLHIAGSARFKAQLVIAAARAGDSIRFDDPQLEARRQQLSRNPQFERPPKEGPPDERSTTATAVVVDRGRARRGPGGAWGRAGTDRTAASARRDAAGGERFAAGAEPPAADYPGTHAVVAKPDLGRLGRVPPPQSRNRLRALSALGVVRIAGGSEVLLPRHVPGDVEQQGADADHGLRRRVSRPGTVGADDRWTRADRYIAERESKRIHGFAIPKHRRYTEADGTALEFRGTRRVDGSPLAILGRGDESLVLPIDDATAQRLSRAPLGQTVNVTARGGIAIKARSR